jgi:hypothetical protein
MDLERTISNGIAHYWKRNKHGYTTNPDEAGRFSMSEATVIVDDDVDRRTVMIDEKVVEKILEIRIKRRSKEVIKVGR